MVEEKPAPKKPPRAPKAKKPDKREPQVCSRCGKHWARHDKAGLCTKCAAEEEDLPPVVTPAGWPDDKPIPTPQEVKRGRIFQIAQLMASGEWRASMAKTLAKSWSTASWAVSVKTVQHYSAEASRLLDYTTGQREKLVQIARVRLLEIAQQDETDRVPAVRTLLENLGELRQNVTVKPAHDPFEGWTDEEITRYGDTGERPERLKVGRSSKK